MSAVEYVLTHHVCDKLATLIRWNPIRCDWLYSRPRYALKYKKQHLLVKLYFILYYNVLRKRFKISTL